MRQYLWELTRDAALGDRADADILAGGERELLDDHADLVHLVLPGHLAGQLQLRRVQQHLKHCQVADQRVCSAANPSSAISEFQTPCTVHMEHWQLIASLCMVLSRIACQCTSLI